MSSWKGGPVNNIDELGAGGHIKCIGPADSVEKFLEPNTGKKYFDKEVYSEEYFNGWRTEDDEIIDEENDIHQIQIAVAWFSKLIPVSILNFRLDFPDCDFEVICESENKLSEWLKVRNYKSIHQIAELLAQGQLDGHETILGWLRFGKSFPERVYEKLRLGTINIEQYIDIVNNKIDINKSFFISE